LFGSRGRGRGGFGQTTQFGGEEFAERGADIEADLMVTLEEAMRGSVREVRIRRPAGRTTKNESYQVRIPPGVTEGQKLRVAGRGETGSGGGAAGDLYLRVRLAKHPDFEVEGHDLIHEVELAPWEAVLGSEISVPTLDGRVKIKIASGTQSGQKLRVRGHGLPARDGGKGDLFVVTKVVVPAKTSDGEKKLWEQLKRETNFNPRD
jgi:curved DNA-binding protein